MLYRAAFSLSSVWYTQDWPRSTYFMLAVLTGAELAAHVRFAPCVVPAANAVGGAMRAIALWAMLLTFVAASIPPWYMFSVFVFWMATTPVAGLAGSLASPRPGFGPLRVVVVVVKAPSPRS